MVNRNNSSEKISYINHIMLIILFFMPLSTLASDTFDNMDYGYGWLDRYDMEEIFTDYRILQFPVPYNKSYHYYINAIELNHNLALEAIETRQEILTEKTKKINYPPSKEGWKQLEEIFIEEADIYHTLVDKYYLSELNLYHHLIYNLDEDEELTEEIKEKQIKNIISKEVDSTYNKFHLYFQSMKDDMNTFCVKPKFGRIHYELCTNIYKQFKDEFITSFRVDFDISMRVVIGIYLREQERQQREREFMKQIEEYRKATGLD